jgi:hypothetical protein
MNEKKQIAEQIQIKMEELNLLVEKAKELKLIVQINADNQARSIGYIKYTAKIYEVIEY